MSLNTRRLLLKSTSIFLTAVMVLCLVLFLAVVLGRLFGVEFWVVRTGSMVP